MLDYELNDLNNALKTRLEHILYEIDDAKKILTTFDNGDTKEEFPCNPIEFSESLEEIKEKIIELNRLLSDFNPRNNHQNNFHP